MPRYWWFQGASVDALREQLNAQADPRLEVYLKGDRMTLRVAADADKTSVEEGTIDESHPCPPQCVS